MKYYGLLSLKKGRNEGCPRGRVPVTGGYGELRIVEFHEDQGCGFVVVESQYRRILAICMPRRYIDISLLHEID